MKMNQLIDTQREQVDTFNSGTRQIKQDILAELDRKLEKRDNDKFCQSLKDQAFDNRHKLILMGLPEDQSKSTRQLTHHSLKNRWA